MNQRKLIILFVVIFGISTNCFGDTLPTMEEQSKAFQFNQQGIALLGKGDFIQARSFFEKASKLHPQHPEYTNNIGVTYLNEGKLDQAIMYFTQSTEKNPSYARAFYNLGVVHQKQQNNEKALQNYLKTVNIDNSITEAYFNLGIIYTRMGNKSKRLKVIKNLLIPRRSNTISPKKMRNIKLKN
ncbi:tetratricopeptide repeat protein [Leptospira borgpetersenii serovar Ballum]|uniref:Tetratricopeptide repeat protein n=1 Tax=Leptospira borgpetersenii serovar Ballum TaxID=280505 RepID=A0A0S2IWG8_LEPBO|nr:tetratricopeptide repeat protein [Leptospira borgpetersenii serovar Ballum]ANH02186.2 Tetratricopeptide repeat protein [Leptospira borgpetersenii str. 4E]